MPQTTNADQCCTVRLPQGVRDQLVAHYGQPFSTIVRFMCLDLLRRAKDADRPPVRQELKDDISNGEEPPHASN